MVVYSNKYNADIFLVLSNEKCYKYLFHNKGYNFEVIDIKEIIINNYDIVEKNKLINKLQLKLDL